MFDQDRRFQERSMPPEDDDDYIRADLVCDPPQNDGGDRESTGEEPITPNFEPIDLSDAELNDPNAMTMEPKGYLQKWESTMQNTIEVFQLCLIFLSAQLNSSLISASFLLIAHIQVLFVTMSTRSRVEVTFYVQIVLMVLLVAAIGGKAMFYGKVYKDDTEPVSTMHRRLMRGLGFTANTTLNKTNGGKMVHITTVTGGAMAFSFEVATLISMTFVMLWIAARKSRVNSFDPTEEEGKRKLARLLIYKAYSHDAKFTAPADMDKGLDDIKDKNLREEAEKKYENYSKFMELYEKHPDLRVFVGNFAFQKKSGFYFLMIILLNLMQTVARNGLIDIPGLFFILILTSVAILRKRFPVFYGFFALIMTYFYALLVLVKVLHEQALQISFVQVNIEESFNSTNPRIGMTTKLMVAAFGVNINQTAVKFVQRSISDPNVIVYRLSLMLLLYYIHAYRSAKWTQIKDKVEFLKQVEDYHHQIYKDQPDAPEPKRYSSLEYAQIYFRFKDVLITYNQRVQFFTSQFEKVKSKKSGGKTHKFEEILRSIRLSTNKSVEKKDSFSIFMSSIEDQVPFLIKIGIKLGLLVQAYMYHSALGMMHLFFFLLSFVVADKVFFYISSIIILPIYTWEYMIVYLSQTPLLHNYKYFKDNSKFFVNKMEYPIPEQLLYLFVLIQLFMSVSCLLIAFKSDTVEQMTMFFRNKIKERHGFSIVFKLVFLIMRYMYLIVLFTLFFSTASGKQAVKARSLGLIIFLTAFLSSEQLYRKTNWLLSLFICCFIMAQYYFSLTWYRWYDNEPLMEKLEWCSLYKKEYLNQVAGVHNKNADWQINQPVYFQHTPYWLDYAIIFMLAALNLVDQMYANDQADGGKLDRECRRRVSDDYPKLTVFLIQVQERSQVFLTLIVFGFVGYQLVNLQVCFISWLFFIFLVLILAFIGKLDNKDGTVSRIVFLSKCFKYFTATMLIAECLFVTYFGTGMEKNRFKKDKEFQKNYPIMYQSLDSIGFRKKINYTQRNKTIRAEHVKAYTFDKMFTYLLFLIISMFLTSYFQSNREENKKRSQKTEEQWSNLFNFKVSNNLQEIDDKNDGLDRLDDFKSAKIGAKSSVIDRKSFDDKFGEEQTEFDQEDIIQTLEIEKVTREFASYRLMYWWPTLDWFALYGQVISALIIVVSAIFFSTSLFSLINMGILCTYFFVATRKTFQKVLQQRAQVGVLRQADLHFAKKITDDYQNISNFQFIYIRKSLWNIQMVMVTVCFIIGYPTSIIMRARTKEKYNSERRWDEEDLAKYHRKHPKATVFPQLGSLKHKVLFDYKILDNWIFWLNFVGVLHDESPEIGGAFFIPYFMMYIALFFERICILWLVDRFGCGYREIQKYSELEARAEFVYALKSKEAPWKAFDSIPYNFESYKQFLYTKMPNDIEERFKESQKEATSNKRKNKLTEAKLRDYMDPFNAVALKDAIKFQVRLTGLCPDIVVDEETQNKMPLCSTTVQGLKILQHEDINLLDVAETVANSQDNEDNENLNFDEDEPQVKNSLEEDLDIDNNPNIYLAASNPEAFQESIPVIKEYKEAQLRKNLIYFVDFKYRMSFNKGMKMLSEALILLCMMISVILKSNIFSLFYLCFILKYITTTNKLELIVKIVKYTVVFVFTQYLMALINFNHESAAQRFPEQFRNYPDTEIPQYGVPVFFNLQVFREDLTLCYLLGVSIHKTQIVALIFDFLFLYLSVMYILKFGNPLFQDTDKLFWQYPKNYDAPKKWNRLDDEVYAQVKWLNRITTHTDANYEDAFTDLNEDQDKIYRDQYQNGLEYRKTVNNYDLEKQLVTFVDLSYKKIVSQDYVRQKKMELKKQSNYYRLVKQGSLLIYLTFHILTIFIVLVASTVRQSVLGFIYVLFLLPHLKSAAEVLTQRLFAQEAKRTKFIDEIKDLEEVNIKPLDIQINKLEEEKKDLQQKLRSNTEHGGFQRAQVDALKEKIKGIHNQLDQKEIEKKKYEHQLQSIRAEKLKIEQDKTKPAEEKEAERDLIDKYNSQSKWFKCCSMRDSQVPEDLDPRNKWTIVTVLSVQLVFIAFADYAFQICVQMPTLRFEKDLFRQLGIRKVWHNSEHFRGTYRELIDPHIAFEPLKFDVTNFCIQCLTCYIITILLMQKEIFYSFGYRKFITQKNGSMDLLVKLAQEKARAMTYAFNNTKIKKIIKIQSDKEKILLIADKLKNHLVNWRKWTQSCLNPNYAKVVALMQQEENKKAKEEAAKKGLKRTNQFQEQLKNQTSQNTQNTQRTSMTTKTNRTEQMSDEDFEEQTKRLPKELVDPYIKKLSAEFVENKKKNLSCCAGFYLFLQENFVNQLLIMQEKDEIDRNLKDTFNKDGVEFHNELERIMYIEADELIRAKYETREGLKELNDIIKKAVNSNDEKSLLDLTKVHKHIKLKQMEQTMAFTRFCSMVEKIFIETIFQIALSSADNLAYLAMIFSMYVNAGLCSVIYPVAVFGYALLEETRPRRWFWRYILYYTIFLLLLKFTWNLTILEFITSTQYQNRSLKTFQGYLHFGLRKYKTLLELTFYIVPELLIVFFITLNEIKLNMIGLFYQIEEDIEVLPDAFSRACNKNGDDDDLEVVDELKDLRNNMIMDTLFKSRQGQIIDQQNAEKMEEEKRKKENQKAAEQGVIDGLKAKQEQKEEKPKTKQEFAAAQFDLIKMITKKIETNSRDFFVDSGSKIDNGKIESVRKQNLLIKQLETDDIMFIEGYHTGSLAKDGLQMLNHGVQDIGRQLKEAKEKVPLVNKIKIGRGDDDEDDDGENISACDFQEEFDQKQEYLDSLDQPVPSMFESIPYFVRLFPTLKQQKPGVDWYLSSTCSLLIIFIYTFCFYNQMTINEQALLKKAAKAGNIFKGQMSIMLIIIIVIIVLERFINRTDTKKTKNILRTDANQKEHKETTYYKESDMLQKTDSQLTVKVQKTQRTAVMDVNSDAAQSYLKQLQGHDDENEIYEGLDNEENQTNITKQQVCKYILHWIIIAYALIHIFWVLPIEANMKLYGKPFCDGKEMKTYTCMDFQGNLYFKIYFWLWCLYIYCSAQQIRHGLPIKKIASSIAEIKSDLNPLPMQIYDPLPFAIEIRCILDWIFSKTALDPYQHWQCYGYLRDLYLQKWSTICYTYKVLGTTIDEHDPPSVITGYVFCILFFVLLAAPLFLFSDLNFLFIKPNPVLKAQLKISLKINKTIDADELLQSHRINNTKKSKKIKSTSSFLLYQADEPYLQSFKNESEYNQNVGKRFKSWAETKFFNYDRIQQCIGTEFGDSEWEINFYRMKMMDQDLRRAFDKDIYSVPKPKRKFNVSLAIDYQFTRKNPPETKVTKGDAIRTLDVNYFEDCITAKKLQEVASLNCDDPINHNKSLEVIFYSAFNSELVLGSTPKTYPIIRKGIAKNKQMYDLRLTYKCPRRQWLFHMSKSITYGQLKSNLTDRMVDPSKNCAFKDNATAQGRNESEMLRNGTQTKWQRLHFTLFSMLAPTSFFADYSPIAWYTAMVFGTYAMFRTTTIWYLNYGWYYELTHPEALLKLVEGVYLKRHEEDLVGEEEFYRMIQEFVRSPELLKAVTGSSLLGESGPKLDQLFYEDRNKMLHLEKMERKGYDVAKLKDKIFEKRGIVGDINDGLDADRDEFKPGG